MPLCPLRLHLRIQLVEGMSLELSLGVVCGLLVLMPLPLCMWLGVLDVVVRIRSTLNVLPLSNASTMQESLLGIRSGRLS